jgi:hypothetical protein
MTITICGSIKFFKEMKKVQKKLEKLGHKTFLPIKAKGVDYWGKDNKARVEAKKKFKFIDEHLDKIELSEAIIVVYITKGRVKNYIGANTFLELGYAHYRKKKIFLLNPIPNQPYIIDELLTMDLIILDGNLEKIN